MAEAPRLAAALRYQQGLDDPTRPATVNPMMARQVAKSRELMTAPTSIMDERYPAWKKAQEDADLFLLGADAAGLAPFAAKGATVAAKFAAPKLAQGLEQHMIRSGMMLHAAPQDEALRLTKKQELIEPTDYLSALRIEPPHEVTDTEKLNLLIKSMKENGWQGRPILIYDVGRGNEALTGSHRIQAARQAGIEVPVYKIENASDYVDKYGDSIIEASRKDLGDQIQWITKFANKFGDKNPVKLLKQEPYNF